MASLSYKYWYTFIFGNWNENYSIKNRNSSVVHSFWNVTLAFVSFDTTTTSFYLYFWIKKKWIFLSLFMRTPLLMHFFNRINWVQKQNEKQNKVTDAQIIFNRSVKKVYFWRKAFHTESDTPLMRCSCCLLVYIKWNVHSLHSSF